MTKSPRLTSTFASLAHLSSSSLADGLAVLEPWHAAQPRDVEQHAAADHLVFGVLDAELADAAAVDFARVETVIHLVFVEDVAERIPMGGGLHRHIDGVVGVADARHFVLAAGDRVGAGRQHGVDRIPAAAEQAGLRAAAVERNAEREHLAGAYQAGGAHDVFGRDVIERADLVVFAPAAPIFEFLGGLGDRLTADGNIHSSLPPALSVQLCTGSTAEATHWKV